MPYDEKTGIPQHRALNPSKAPGGRLLPLDHTAWESTPPWDVNPHSALLEPQVVVKKKRNNSQPVSTVGFFALYRSDKKAHNKSRYIGKGSFGKVKFAQRQDGKWFAVKTIAAHPSGEQMVKKEATILHKAGKLEAFYVRSEPNADNLNVYYLVQEWIDGIILRKFIPQLMGLSLNLRILEASNFIHAINQINDQKISHRDISTNNIIRKHDGSYELIDFGLSECGDLPDPTADLQTALYRLPVFFSPKEYSILRQHMQNYLEKTPTITAIELRKAILFGFKGLGSAFDNPPVSAPLARAKL